MKNLIMLYKLNNFKKICESHLFDLILEIL